MSAPGLLIFALGCLLLSYGLFRRPRWAWYAGAAVLLWYAVGVSLVFAAFLSESVNTLQTTSAFVYWTGGLLFWFPLARWWFRQRSKFGAVKARSTDAGSETSGRP